MATQLPRLDGIEPVFFYNKGIIIAPGANSSDSQSYLKPYEVCIAAANVVTREHIVGAQNIRGIWRLYMKTRESRTELLIKGLTLRHKRVTLFDKNPQSTRNNDPDTKVEKIIIKDLPLSMDNAEIGDFFKQMKHVVLTSQIRDAHERNDQGELTHFKNGDRFVYATHPISPPIERQVKIAGRQCRVFHNGQNNFCKICGLQGHRQGDSVCNAVTDNLEAVTFSSYEHPLSNSYQCSIPHEGLTFASAEHALQWARATELGCADTATNILDARHAGVAKAIGNKIEIKDQSSWEQKREKVMFEILTKKLRHCEAAATALEQSRGKLIVLTTRDLYWGSGLNDRMTQTTNPTFWPGQNILGAMLTELRENHIRTFKSDPEHAEERVSTISNASDDENTTPQPSTATRTEAEQNEHTTPDKNRGRSHIKMSAIRRLSPRRRAASLSTERSKASNKDNHIDEFIRLAWKRKANTPPAENSNKQYRTELYSGSQPTSTCRDPGR